MTRTLASVLLALGLVAGAHAATSGSITGTVLVNPLSASLSLSSGSTAVGSQLTATATVRNSGAMPLSVTVTLTADVNLAVAGGVTRTIALAAKGTAQVSWSLCALAPGGYVVLANATSGPLRTDSPAQVLNVSAGSGQCPKDATAALLPGGSLSTDREGDGATPASPVETAVTLPSGGIVSIAQRTASFTPTAFSFLGQQVQISAPTATAALPLRIAFRLDPWLGASLGTLEIFRNGVVVRLCGGAGATPDPCVISRTTLPDGDIEIVVLTSAASTWTFGSPIVRRGGLGAALTTSNRHIVALLVASDGNRIAGAVAFDAFRATNGAALAVSSRKAWYAGFGTDGRPFLVYAEDNGPNGRGDVFRMWIGGVEQTSDGKVAKGDVAVTS